MMTFILLLFIHFVSSANAWNETEIQPLSCIMYLKNNVWSAPPRLKQIDQVNIPVASGSLNYGRVLTSDIHGYKGIDRKIRLLDSNFKFSQLNYGAKMLVFTKIPRESYLYCVRKLVKRINSSLPPKTYLTFRAMVFDIHKEIEPDAADSIFAMIAFNTPNKMNTGESSITARVEPFAVRNYNGSLTNVRTSTNFVPTLLPDKISTKMGYSTTVWLNNGNIIEFSFANVFFVIYNNGYFALNTPPRSSVIFDESLRRLILKVAKRKGIKVEETLINVDELRIFVRQGIVIEMFAAQLNGCIVPVTKIVHEKEEIVIPTMEQTKPLYAVFQKEVHDLCFSKSSVVVNDVCWTL